mmetsp:Transcript_1679/g.2562  ORF Transcript_1679/g.2562 Transcript_1679/m.2562 type:complete len:90 (+) Transcript_1679:860-1129(+)|eukprot:CAMPEP_0203764012 /NCGR_PEP_ID=MMETSP0098-20131031/17304_1 /ASSEMBLY_ACC=CAM_ASM_000208 /TAXON_ID=96639 /ORGANISM=" , Strain NY0313808BC1" /LENGTH=89 /DNA_ID=CAMNT_0050659587 /DNA_START=1424 /DNA_END=1693 /DNA_ORIENTATION=-
MTNKILNKWHNQRKRVGGFLHFLDGDTLKVCIENLERVRLVDALDNPDWLVDWDCELRPCEERMVRANMEEFHHLVTRLINEGHWTNYF